MPSPAITPALTAEPASLEGDSHQFQTGRVVTLTAGHAIHDTYTAFLAPLLPAFKENLLLSNTQLGLLTVFMNAPSLLQPVLGYLGDRADLRTLVSLAPAVAGVTMSLLGVAPGYAALALLLLVAGLNSANLHAVAPVMAGRLSGDRLGRGMGFWMVGGELGRTLGPLIVVTAVARLGLQGTPWLMAFGFLASLLVYRGLRGVPMHAPQDGDRPASWQALRSMGPFLVPLVAILVVRALMIGALTTYLPVFLSEEGATLWRAGAALSLLQAAGVVGALLGGALSDRLGRRLILALSLLLTPVFMFAFLAAKPPEAGGTGDWGHSAPAGVGPDLPIDRAGDHGPGAGELSAKPILGQRHLRGLELFDQLRGSVALGCFGRPVWAADGLYGERRRPAARPAFPSSVSARPPQRQHLAEVMLVPRKGSFDSCPRRIVGTTIWTLHIHKEPN